MLGDKPGCTDACTIAKRHIVRSTRQECSAPISLVSVYRCKLGRRPSCWSRWWPYRNGCRSKPGGKHFDPTWARLASRRQCRSRRPTELLDPANYSDELYARALRPLVRFHSADANIFYLYTMVARGGVPLLSYSTQLRHPTCAQITSCAHPPTWNGSISGRNTKTTAGWTRSRPVRHTCILIFEQDDYGRFSHCGPRPSTIAKAATSGFVGVDFDLQYYFAQEARFAPSRLVSVIAAVILALGHRLPRGAVLLRHARLVCSSFTTFQSATA